MQKDWPPASERELRDYEDQLVSLLDQARRLHRQRDRTRTALLDRAALPQLVVGSFEAFEVVSCAVCARDHKATIGPELLVSEKGEEHQVVCWACGMEFAPELAAKVLARRADFAEQGAVSILATAERWLEAHIRASGNVERATHFDRLCGVLRAEPRRLKGERYADPATWL